MIAKKESQKLFRITTKRDIILGRALGSVESTINSREDRLEMLPYRPKLESDERFRLKIELIDEIGKLKEAYDVLTVTRCHSQPHLVDLWMKEERAWRSEWDVPIETFERAMNTIIESLKWYKERSNTQVSRYEEAIQLLLEVLAFRKAVEE